MSHLLGAQDCVESLRRDVIDLQGALVEVFSRTGPVRFRSWKFPDKESCDLDLVQLLEQYDYMEGEQEFNQLSHIVLLELVIDRLLLLLQSFNAYTEQMLGGPRAGDRGNGGGSVCVGPVVKRYWKNLIHFSRQQRTSSAPPISSSSWTHPRISSFTSQTSAPSSPLSRSLHTSPTPSARSRDVSSQTVESSLVPCDACAGVQASLQTSAHAVASLCRALGLSCSLWGLLQAVEETLQIGRLSACDLALWAREQQDDLGRIQKHVAQVQEKVESLTHSLEKAEKERDKLRAQLEKEKEMRKRERQDRDKLRAQLEREKETSERERQDRRRREEEMERTQQEEKNRRDEELRTLQEDMRRGAAALEEKICGLEAELQLQRETQQCLARERDSLVNEVHRFCLEEERWKETEEKKRNLETELRDTQKHLDKESAKYHSTQRQHEAMVVKQRALLERVDVLAQQCEELQSRLDECEDEKIELSDTLTHTTQERHTLQEQLTQQKADFLALNEDRQKLCVTLQKLEVCVSRLTEDLQQAEERERILVAFPELNLQHTTPQSTGDVLGDMEQQLKVNSIRIRVLEQENTSLNKTLLSLKHTRSLTLSQQSAGDHTPSPPASRGSEGKRREKANEKQITKSPSSALHHQTLCLSVLPNAEASYTKLLQVRARSAGISRRRK
ncbi:coiled-coil domain-containing protein 157 [Silurus meridionalis]|nr:coiled-coil domain-containing protein 157 [Silurus meridionalis]